MSERDAKELESIKRLLILLLVKLGASSPEIGAALGIDESAVRRLVPARKVKKLAIPYVE
jgi:hypothetical protein